MEAQTQAPRQIDQQRNELAKWTKASEVAISERSKNKMDTRQCRHRTSQEKNATKTKERSKVKKKG